MTRPLLVLAGLGSLTACLGVAARPSAPPGEAHPAGVLQLRWRTPLHPHDLSQAVPEECATGTVVAGRLVIGSRAARIAGVDTASGHVDWTLPTAGGIDSEARYDAARGQVYVGSDDGTVYAVSPADGLLRWSYKGRGAVERPPAFDQHKVFVSTAADKVFALDAGNGKWLWQYERETPEDFTIHGHAGPLRVGDRILAGFADGTLAALDAGSGEVVWARSLAAASDHFVDVDATPAEAAGVLYASSYSGGLYALDPKDGSTRWRLGIEGVGGVRVGPGGLYFAASREGIHAADRGGNVRWRQALTEAGDLTTPLVTPRLVIFSGSRQGLFVVARDTGALLQTFNPGNGVCAGATLDPDGRRLYVLSNGGSLYAFDLGG